jgi:cytochrome c-type biogenesis protein CcmH/NrfG
VTDTDRWLRLLRPVGLLALFALAIRGLPERTRQTVPVADCETTARDRSQVGRLERCLAQHPDDVELMSDLGDAYDDAGKRDRAESVYRRALDIDPDDGDVHVRLGGVLLRRGDAAGAGREGAAALKMQPGSLAALELIRRAAAVPAGADR